MKIKRKNLPLVKNAGFIATLCIMGGVLVVAIFLMYKSRVRFTPRRVSFDPDSCVRLMDISRVYKIRRDRHRPDYIWFATAQGIRRFDLEHIQWTRFGLDHGLGSETVSDICFSERGVFAGTWRGVFRLERGTGRFSPLSFCDTLQDRRILAVQWMDGRGLFISVDGRGLYLLEPGGECARRIGLPSVKTTDRITCLESDGDGLLIGVEGRRLLQYRGEEGSFTELSFRVPVSEKSYVWDVLRRDGELWVATSDDGVWRKGARDDTLRRVERFPAKGAYAFGAEDDGFWCGTPYGLWRYREKDSLWMQFVHPREKRPTDFQVMTLAPTAARLWYGSMDLGAGYLKKDKMEWRPMRAGLSASNVVAAAADDKELWTAYGYEGGFIDRFEARTLQYDKNYGRADRLLDPNVQALLLRDNRLYFGSFRGFGYIDLPAYRFVSFIQDSNFAGSDVVDIVARDEEPWLLATLYGVVEYYPSADTFSLIKQTSAHRITCIHDEDSLLWLGTLGGGVRLYDYRAATERRAFLEQVRRVVGIFPLASGGLFAATERSGCFVIDRGASTARGVALPEGMTRSSGRFAADIAAARQVDGRIWIGTAERGCFIYSPAQRKWYTCTWHDGLVSDQVCSIFDTAGYLWIGCYGGITRFDKTYIESLLARRDAG